MSYPTTRIAPGHYRVLTGGPERVEITRTQQDDGTFWVVLVDDQGGHDLYRTKREALAAAPGILATERELRRGVDSRPADDARRWEHPSIPMDDATIARWQADGTGPAAPSAPTPAHLATPHRAVEAYRKAAAALRTIERNQRLERYQGRNRGATDDALYSHRAAMTLASATLRTLTAGTAAADEAHRLAGWLEAEHTLSARISEARDAGQERPELAERLRDARRAVRALTNQVADYWQRPAFDPPAADAIRGAATRLAQENERSEALLAEMKAPTTVASPWAEYRAVTAAEGRKDAAGRTVARRKPGTQLIRDASIPGSYYNAFPTAEQVLVMLAPMMGPATSPDQRGYFPGAPGVVSSLTGWGLLAPWGAQRVQRTAAAAEAAFLAEHRIGTRGGWTRVAGERIASHAAWQPMKPAAPHPHDAAIAAARDWKRNAGRDPFARQRWTGLHSDDCPCRTCAGRSL